MPLKANNTVWIRESDFEALFIETIRWFPFETGGVIIGYWGNQYEAVVTGVIGPGSKAKHRRFSFVPDSEFHDNEIAKVYKHSNRTETYLGDWHTHPNADSYLSSTDKKTLRCIADYKEARLQKPLMMVLGTKPFSLRVWLYEYKNANILSKGIIKDCKIRFY